MNHTNTQQRSFSLTLLSNTIVSQSSATAGDHQCLDFIPGATLLGVAASRLYSELSSEESDLLFQSGRVRFGDALPQPDNQIAWPMPLCWHHIKGQSPFDRSPQGQMLIADGIFDPSLKKPEEGQQPKQMRTGHITAQGGVIHAEKDYALKTAIDATSGSAAESQLFGYESLCAGQCFGFTLSADADVDDNLLQKLAEALTGRALIGRSRSAQFGQVSIEAAPDTHATPRCSATQDDTLTLWLMSDLALTDPRGNALLTPTPQALGLPEGSEWIAQRSFLRTRSYTPYNAKRRCYDPQRQVISRGSVLRYTLPQKLDKAQTEALRFQGLYQAAGLGQISVNPELLAQAQPAFEPAPAKTRSASSNSPAEPDSDLAHFLKQKATQSDSEKGIARQAEQLAQKIKGALKDAAAYAGQTDKNLPTDAPSKTQWGTIREVAKNHPDQPELNQKLFVGDHAPIRSREGQRAWQLATGPGETLADSLKEAINNDTPGAVLALACTQLMREVDHESQ